MFKNKLIISFIGFYIFWLLIAPQITSKAILLVCNTIFKNSRYELQVQNLKTVFSILPTISFRADKISVISKKDISNLCIEDFRMKIRLLPLLSKKVHVNTLWLGKLAINANLEESLELDKDFLVRFKNRPYRVDSLNINELTAKVYKKDIDYPILYKGKEFQFQRKNSYIKIQNNSVLDIDNKISKITSNVFLPKNNDIRKTTLEVNVDNIDIAPLQNYFKHYLPKDLKKISGIVNVNATKEGCVLKLKNCAITMADNSKSNIFPQDVTIKSKFLITRSNINFENIDFNSSNIHVNIKGRIIDYLGKVKPKLDFNLIINNSKINDIVAMLPSLKFEELDISKLKKYNLNGDVLANINIKGRYLEPDINGDIYMSNCYLDKNIIELPKGATIKINLSGRRANFDAVVPVEKLEKVFVKGYQEIYNTKYSELTVKSTEFVNLKTAQKILLPLHEILNFIVGPLPILDISGTGNIDIEVKGNRRNPHIWGIFNINNAVANFNNISNLKLLNLDAKLNFDDQKVVFSNSNGEINSKKIIINGFSNLDGKFEYNIKALDQCIEHLCKAITTSNLPENIKTRLQKLNVIKGNIDATIKLFGTIKEFDNLDFEFNKNIFVEGSANLKNIKLIYHNVLIDNINGSLKFYKENLETKINAIIEQYPFLLDLVIKNNNIFIDFDIPKLDSNLLILDAELAKKNFLPYLSIKGNYSGHINKPNYDNLKIKAMILGSLPESVIKYNSGSLITIEKNEVLIKNLKGYINSALNTFNVNLKIDEPFVNPKASGILDVKIPSLNLLNDIFQCDILPNNLKKVVENYKFTSGGLDLKARISNNKIFTNLDLSSISFVYQPLNMPVEIINGFISLRNNIIKLNKINFLADEMPMLADGEIKDLFGKQNFNLYINSKPQQEFIDKYINTNQIYPLKIKGDIVYLVKLKGEPDNYNINAEIDMSKNSSIYHFGATIGDIENAIRVSLDSRILKNKFHKIKEFSYDKIINSQSGRQTRLNLLKASGGFEVLENDLLFDNLWIKTSHPTDARIFNIIFRKPNIKQGQFTSDLKLSGMLSSPKILGDFHIFETDIPFLDISMKNIELIFSDKFINFDAKGDVMGNDIVFDGILLNKLTTPYKIEKANLYTKNLDLNNLIEKLKIAEVDTVSTFDSLEGFDLSLITAKEFNLKADAVRLRNINATDFNAVTSLDKNGMLKVNDFQFNIAQGTLNGKFLYDLKSNDMGINLYANMISANDLTKALFDLDNQIYGDLTGNIELTCNGIDFSHCMQTLSGNTIFNVKDGRMPKLGSLEYLLKAGNIVKGGLTGVSINSIIDILTPSKTGQFSDIFGNIKIKDGIAENFEITTKGNDLSLYIAGTYNFATSIADLDVLGLLSRKITTLFGPIGNLSLNTLFNIIPGVDLSKDSALLERINKIPGIELSSKEFRKFIAVIKGNINGEDYVTSFKWIN
ncbi:hypothetical protein J6R97_00235 [bacterium]|nr:hypothetical protein [bacterium]